MIIKPKLNYIEDGNDNWEVARSQSIICINEPL